MSARSAQSGTKGIFVTETQVHQRSERARWLPKEKSGEAEHYLRSSLEFARSRQQGLKFRMGGGSDLGLGVVANKQDTLDAKPLVLDATGVPLSWDGTALRSFMTDQGWQGVDFFPEKRLPVKKLSGPSKLYCRGRKRLQGWHNPPGSMKTLRIQNCRFLFARLLQGCPNTLRQFRFVLQKGLSVMCLPTQSMLTSCTRQVNLRFQ